ncbi:MAG: HAMP domain-containing sensor histidine kinase [Alphaproteobacteria bacterium]|nr:HAMP domain-containing sensor histidine kinase [Alphaproteobacteria bacterium]
MAFSIQHLYRNSVALLCVTFVVVLTPALSALSYFEQRNASSRFLATQARMIAALLGEDAALSDTKSDAMLAQMDVNAEYDLACIYATDGTTKAARHGLHGNGKTNALAACERLYKTKGTLNSTIVSAPIIRHDLPQPVGELLLVCKLPSPFADMLTWLVVSSLLALLLALFCWVLGLRLQHTLIKPLRQIASTAQRVSLYKDYSLRVVPGALDVLPYEMQSLTDSFNAMLKEIEDRDSRLSRKSAELDRAREAAESANQAKSQFLANVSHELRTPLNAIIGFSTMLHEEQFGPLGNPKYVEYARDIHDSGRHLLDVINDILDLTKAETGKLTVVFQSLNFAKLLEKALRIVAGQAHQRKIDIYTDLPEKLPKIIADPVRLVQILLNLLSNAIKFSHEGGKIVVRARAESARQGVHYFTITIEDNGIGMSEAAVRKAFSTFNQADAGLNRKYEGAGLGLPLTKRLVDLHHGKIKIESVEGKGTTVTVRLTSDPALLD